MKCLTYKRQKEHIMCEVNMFELTSDRDYKDDRLTLKIMLKTMLTVKKDTI